MKLFLAPVYRAVLIVADERNSGLIYRVGYLAPVDSPGAKWAVRQIDMG
jgi:hypothetical protein